MAEFSPYSPLGGSALAETAGSAPDARPLAAAPARRAAEPLPNPGPFQAPVRLAWQPTPEPLRYEATACWEERTGREVKRTVVVKQLTLNVSALAQEQLLLTLETAPPTLRKPDLLPQEEMVLTLAGLYRKLALRMAPTGQLLAVVNQPEIEEAWREIRPQLVARYGDDDQVMGPLLAAVAAQVAQPERLFESLQYDYAYRLLAGDFYQQRFESTLGYVQPLAFPEFFAGAALHFRERLELGPAAGPGRVALRLSGRLDEARTDRAAVAAQVAAALALGPARPASPAPDPAALAFAYRAAYDLDAATGWPVAVEATVSCQSPAGYAKEYDFTLAPL